jgi:hypothetical protein
LCSLFLFLSLSLSLLQYVKKRKILRNAFLFSNNNGFTQFEISPFHSAKFPTKNKFAKDILNAENNLHTEYIDKLFKISKLDVKHFV